MEKERREWLRWFCVGEISGGDVVQGRDTARSPKRQVALLFEDCTTRTQHKRGGSQMVADKVFECTAHFHGNRLTREGVVLCCRSICRFEGTAEVITRG